MRPDPVTPQQRTELIAALAPFASRIERVDLYGSRANGTHRPGSDIDLVLDGPIDAALLGRIITGLDESWLSVHADVVAYSLLEQGTFRDRVLATARPFLSRRDLEAIT